MTNLHEFQPAEINAANELHNTVLTAEQTGATARVTQALALYDLHRTEGFLAVTNPETGNPFAHWTEYIGFAVPSQSPTAISKAVRVASLLGNADPARLAAAGIEKLYMGLQLVDKKVIGLDDVVDYATKNTLLDLRALLTSKNPDKERRYPLTEFTVTKAAQDRFAGVLNVFRTALKQSDNGAEPSDWTVLDAAIETMATLDPGYVLETVSGEGGSGPRQSSSFTDTPPEEVVKWVAQKYIENGHSAEQTLRLMQDAVSGELQQLEMQREIEERQRKAEELEAKAQQKKVDATINKLIKMSNNIKVETADGSSYLVVDVFKGEGENPGTAHIKAINESKEPAFTLPEGGAQVQLTDLAPLVLSTEKMKVEKPKAEKAEPAQFSKQAQTKKAATKKGNTSAPNGKRGKAASVAETEQAAE